MKPAEVSAKLHRIADAIDNSKKPQRLLVASDLKMVVAAMSADDIRQEISHTLEGPVTDFVLVSRAMEQVQRGANPADAANALYEELKERGFLAEGHVEPSTEEPIGYEG